jgi:hypothetical protein
VHIAGEQDFNVVVTIALAEEIGIVAKSLHHFALELQLRAARDIRREMFRADPQRDFRARFKTRRSDLPALMNAPERALPSARPAATP